MWTVKEKTAPRRLRPALITVNLHRHSHQKYHPGIFLFTSCRSSSVTFNLCKYLPFENLSFPHLSLNKSAPVFLLQSSFHHLLLPIPWLGSFPSKPPFSALQFFLPGRGISTFPRQIKALGAQGIAGHIPGEGHCVWKSNQNLPSRTVWLSLKAKQSA